MKGNTSHGFRKQFLTDEALKILCKARELNPHGTYVFEPNGEIMTTDSFNRRLKKYCKEAGVPYYSSHKIRFYNASTAFDGNNLTTLSYLTGHSETATTLHCLRNVNKRKDERNAVKSTFLSFLPNAADRNQAEQQDDARNTHEDAPHKLAPNHHHAHTNTKRKSTDDSEQYSTDGLAVAFNGRLALHLAADDQHGKQHNHSDTGNSNALTKCVPFREQTHTHADSEQNASDGSHDHGYEILFLHFETTSKFFVIGDPSPDAFILTAICF